MSYDDAKHHNTKLTVSNIALGIREDEMREIFERYGPIVKIHMKIPVNSRVQAATVKYMRTEQAILARDGLSNYLFPGAKQGLEIKLSNYKPTFISPTPVFTPNHLNHLNYPNHPSHPNHLSHPNVSMFLMFPMFPMFLMYLSLIQCHYNF